MNPPLVQSLNLQIKGVSSQARLAGQIVLALELNHLKNLHGYVGGGSHQAYRAERLAGERPPWSEIVEREAGMTEATWRNLMKCAEAVRVRLRFYPRPGTKDLLNLMDLSPAKLTNEQRADMVEKISLLGLVPNETQAYLLREFQAGKTPTDEEPTGADNSDEESLKFQCLHSMATEKIRKRARLLECVLKEIRRRNEKGIPIP